MHLPTLLTLTISLLPTIPAHPSSTTNTKRAEIAKAGSTCDPKFKSSIYPLSPELSFAIEVLPASSSNKDLFHTHVFIGSEKILNPLDAPLDYIANPWEYSYTKQAAFNLLSNGTLVMDNMWCDVVAEHWFGESAIPACPALPTLRRDEGKWEVRSRCVDGVVRLGLEWGDGKRGGWRVAREENPGHEVKQRVHWGRVDGKQPLNPNESTEIEVYLIVSVF
ncbi:hypothetical protein HYALB_00008588 [Hymenoscyphus albidus]|uniref:DUF1996 domain-containing protein n=1 Tax=Hymenoscyphus albidus TaxID=595503 RepID=A0A9N9LEL9_9HELO|nr:hypothetical protein HYALB_00008588 [Hymenoscyphus albidus]